MLPFSVTPGIDAHVYLQMLGMMNCQERTVGEFVTLLKGAGWKIDRVCRFEAPLPQQIICSPM